MNSVAYQGLVEALSRDRTVSSPRADAQQLDFRLAPRPTQLATVANGRGGAGDQIPGFQAQPEICITGGGLKQVILATSGRCWGPPPGASGETFGFRVTLAGPPAGTESFVQNTDAGDDIRRLAADAGPKGLTT